jgi:hypothetical protein
MGVSRWLPLVFREILKVDVESRNVGEAVNNNRNGFSSTLPLLFGYLWPFFLCIFFSRFRRRLLTVRGS